MKISYRWLKEYITTDLTPETMLPILTDTGLEVEGLEEVESVPGGLAGLVIGEVLEKEQHPDADRLAITKVNIGADEALSIVCGAPNVAAGQKVVVATVGTTIHPTAGEPFKIKRSKIRGVESMGMICAEDEIGLGTEHDGIMVLEADAVVGRSAREHFGIESDHMIEIGLTPNRADGMSHVGVARDLAAALSLKETTPYQWPSVENFKVDQTDQAFEVIVEDEEACPRYVGLTLTNVKVGPSPEWMQNRLRTIGVNCINNVVDTTNYVLHEMGQPLHAFDGAKITGGKVIVKKMAEGSAFTTLDGEERKLSSEDLMICNTEGGMCIAGVFGGIESGVTESTTTVFLESAWFDPGTVRKTAKFHGLHTDASYRFERGVDPEITVKALKRAAMLLKEVAGATIASEISDHYPNPHQPIELPLKYAHCDRLIGKALPHDLIRSILESLEFEVMEATDEALHLRVPLYRNDVTREADIIEEVLRIYGFNNVDLPTTLRTNVINRAVPDREEARNRIADLLVSNGYQEMMNNSLTSAHHSEKLALEDMPASEAVPMLNPLSSDLGVMRQSMVFGGLESVAYNNNRQQLDLKFFEFGKVYRKTAEGYEERNILSLFITGRQAPERWDEPADAATFYDLKGMVNKIIARLGINKGMQVKPAERELWAEGLCYDVARKRTATFGPIAQKVLTHFDVKQAVYYAELEWDTVISHLKMNKVKYKPVPKFPTVRRDLSLLLDKGVRFEQIEAIAYKCERQLLKEVSLFDVYEGKNIEKGKKSYAVSFTLQDAEKTLKDKQIDKIIGKIRESVERELGAVIR